MQRRHPKKRLKPWRLLPEGKVPGSLEKPLSWELIDRGLMELIGKSPVELDRMTLPEIAVACIDPEEEAKGNLSGDADVVAYLVWWHSLTPNQQLAYETEDLEL